MSQLASVIIQPASTSKGLPKTSRSGQGQSMAGSSSPFARFLTTAGESPSQESSSQSGPAHADSHPLGQTPTLSGADPAVQEMVQGLANLLQKRPQAGQMLQEAMETGDLNASFMGRLLAALQQSGADGAQMSSLQMAEATVDQRQQNPEGPSQGDIAGSDLLSALLSQMQLQGQEAQPGTQSVEISRLLESVQGQGQVGSQSLDPEARAQLGEILQRMQILLGRSEGQAQNNQAKTQSVDMTRLLESGPGQGQMGSQSLDLETRTELRQLLQRMQAILGQSESKGQAGNGQKALHVEDGGKSAQEGLRASQAAAVSQPVSPQPAPNRGLGYYLHAYQGAEQAGGKGLAQADLVSAGGEGQSSGGSKDGLSGQGRSSLAEAMFLQNSTGGKGQTGAGNGNQFGLTLHNAAETGTGGGSGAAATFTGSPGSSAANPLGGQGASQTFGTQQAVEQSMVDQVRFRLSQGLRSGQQEVVVRMHPRELGEVRLSLNSDDGNLRAHLHVQSQQVQDVLERNMPRLREALAEQGIDVEDFVFSSEDQGQEKEYRSFEQEKWAGGRKPESGSTMPAAPEVHAGKEQAGYSPEQGLSVRI